MRGSLLLALLFSTSILACRRETATQAEPTATSAVKPSESAAPLPAVQALASTNPVMPAASAIAIAPSAQASSAAHAPAPIAPADLERAKQYVNGLTRGRKATAAKDYAAAVGHFDRALKAEPGDARALSERGYAYLLDGKLDEAAKDLETAAKRASSADLLRQILFNQATVAEKRGDTKAAEALRAQRDNLRSAKRSKDKDCQLSISRPGTLPVVVKTFRDAWAEIKKAHFAYWNHPVDTLESPAIDDKATEEEVRKALIGNAPPGDGAWSIQTDALPLQVGHVIIVRGKQIHVLAGLGGFQQARCPFGDGSPTVVDGDLPRIQVDTENLELGYMCSVPNTDDFRPCDEVTDGTPVQSYCYWTGSRFRTLVLDPKTLAIALDIEESVEAGNNKTFDSARPRAVLTLQPDAVLVTGCGVERRETIP
jgi:Flp pilus assembly protein TadD